MIVWIDIVLQFHIRRVDTKDPFEVILGDAHGDQLGIGHHTVSVENGLLCISLAVVDERGFAEVIT